MGMPDEAPRPFVSGLVLAAGASRRMRRPKQLLVLGNRCLLQHVLDAASASRLDEIVLVLGHRVPEIRAALALPVARAVRVVENAEWAAGLSTSLRLGLRAADARAAAAAVLLGDQPGVTSQLIDRLLDAFLHGDAPVVRPVYTGPDARGVPGHPVVLARRVWPEAARLRGDQGARVLVAARPDWLREVPVEGEPPEDLDTWEDYQRVLGVAQRRATSDHGC